jgi:NAD(P)-dependent dehydrogenase (short-subunit alcohol dehydrogenase family)
MILDRFRLTDRAAIVTGAGRGIGRAIALAFAEAGADVICAARTQEEIDATAADVRARGRRARAVRCDVTDRAQLEGLVEAALGELGRLDVLVNNAGITHRSAFAATATDVLRRVMDVNLFGAINLTRPALPHLETARGLIVAVSSVAGFTPLVARTGYAASKHALQGFFTSLRAELAPRGIDVMLVCPSFVATGIDRNALGADGAPARHAQVVVGARLQPDDVANRIFSASERRRRLVLVGRTAHAAWWVGRFAPALYERIMAGRLRAEMGDG